MIRQLRLSGFKSVGEEVQLELAPLSVISGANSSGKSTALQALLVLAQSAMTLTPTRSATLNGRFVHLGTASEILNTQNESKTFNLGVSIVTGGRAQVQTLPDGGPRRTRQVVRRRYPVRQAELDVAFQQPSGDESSTETELGQVRISGTLATPEGREEQCSFLARKSRTSFPVRIAKEGIDPESLDLAEQRSLQYTVKLDKATREEAARDTDLRSMDVRGVLFRHFTPIYLSHRYDYMEVLPQRLYQRISGSWEYPDLDRHVATPEEWQTFLGSSFEDISETFREQETISAGEVRAAFRARPSALRRLRSDWPNAAHLQIHASRGEGPPELKSLELVDVPNRLQQVVNALQQALVGIRYVGPLRLQPSPVYPIATAERSDDVGIAGEQTAAVLERNASRTVTFKSNSSGRTEIISEGLALAVGRVLRDLELVSELKVRDRGSLGHEVLVRTPHAADLAPISHVGVGVSQCLPIIVQCLITRTDEMIVLEQPELHLHPAVQARLADFLLDMSQSGRQLLIESHSEHIISRLRRRIAERRVESEDIALYFAERSPATKYRRVAISDTGTPREWPEGFYDQGQIESEAILRASISRLRGRG